MSVKEEVRGCLIALEALLSEIEEIMGLIADKKQLLGAKKKHAQEKLKIFKEYIEHPGSD